MKDAAGTICLSLWLLTFMCELGNSLSVGEFSLHSEKNQVGHWAQRSYVIKKTSKLRGSIGLGTTQGFPQLWELQKLRVWRARTDSDDMGQTSCTSTMGLLFPQSMLWAWETYNQPLSFCMQIYWKMDKHAGSGIENLWGCWEGITQSLPVLSPCSFSIANLCSLALSNFLHCPCFSSVFKFRPNHQSCSTCLAMW